MLNIVQLTSEYCLVMPQESITERIYAVDLMVFQDSGAQYVFKCVESTVKAITEDHSWRSHSD